MAFLGQESVWAAEAGNCAAEQGQFWAYRDKLFAEQAGRNRGAFSQDNLKRYAEEIGLPSEPFNACVDSGRYAEFVRAERAAGERKGVSSTPTVFVGDRKLPGVPSFEQLSQAIGGLTQR